MKKNRHCLPMRVRTLLAALNGDPIILKGLVSDGCACANRSSCVLADACERIHQSFMPEGSDQAA